MKNQLYIGFLLLVCFSQAQTALYNSGNIRIHENGQLGFHTDLINDAAFDENLGLAGFYGNNQIYVSGAFPPTFFDMEIANNTGVLLQTGINNVNNTNFILGDFLTLKDQTGAYYNFLQNAFYVGDNNMSQVDGYAAITQKQNFTFPVGDGLQLRPLILISAGTNPFAKCAYYFEDPNSPTSLNTSFDTTRKARDIGFVSTTEFWRLEGSIPSTISISWNERSDMATLTDDTTNVLIVGWSKSANQWMIIGTTAAVGDLSQGFVSSESFVPDDYDAITFGTIDVPAEFLSLDEFLVSANGDGINDSFIIPELEQSPNNHLKIYNRFGQMVFDQINYTNQFNGFSNIDNLVIDREQGLPSGVYFYIVSMEDLGLDFQGFLYLTR